ncbi:MAG: accessory factor UbiK family protein [Methylococcales bacterium]
MIDPALDKVAKHLGNSLPSGLHHLRADLEKNFRAILASAFEKLNLVSREEFDVQKAVLAKTREKLAALEKQVASLEEKILPRF